MKTIYGVNIKTPINQQLKNGHTIYDWIVRKKCYPAFCMRTLCGEGKITVDEIEFLRGRGCKIGLTVRDFTEKSVSGINGTGDAMRAVIAAKSLGVPREKKFAIIAEIRPEWSINHNWMISFAQLISNNGYIPGFIGNTDSSKNFNFDRQTRHYIQATKGVNGFDAIFGATEPKREEVPQMWTPFCPSEMQQDDIALWSCGSTSFDEINADDVYARDENVLAYMW